MLEKFPELFYSKEETSIFISYLQRENIKSSTDDHVRDPLLDKFLVTVYTSDTDKALQVYKRFFKECHADDFEL